MNLDVVDLREFYLSSLGLSVRRLLRAKLHAVWPRLGGETVLALGYATPLLRPLLEEANRLISLMPAAQGVTYWPREGGNLCALADFTRLPLPDESVDRVILLHALEGAADVDLFLHEVWRVLKPEGRALFFVPHRRGWWAHNDQTPFGTGQPYSSSQLKNLLRCQEFVVERHECSLHAPPFRPVSLQALAERWEPIGDKLFPAFGGLLVVEASKQLFAPLMVKAQTKQRRFVLSFPCPPRPLPAGLGQD